MKKIPLWGKIIIGMILGIILGILGVKLGFSGFVTDWVKPWGTIFIRLLKLLAVPLVFVSLVKGVASLSDTSKLSRMGIKTLGVYILTTMAAVTVGLLVVNIIAPGDTFPESRRAELMQKYTENLKVNQEQAAAQQELGPMQYVVDIVPDNIISASSDNTKMLQIIFFALLFGVAMVTLKSPVTHVVEQFFDGLNDIILKIVEIVMKIAPLGVFALLSGLVVDFSGDIKLFSALGLYVVTVIVGLVFIIIINYGSIVLFFTKMPLKRYYKGIMPIQLVAFSTSSSAATLPVTKEECEKSLGLSPEVTSFVLPVGVTINMDGTACYQGVAAVFIAQVFGLDLTFTQQVTIVLTATLASIGTPGIPGAAIVMLIMVLTSVGIPVEGLALILGLDRPLDMLRTVVNVSGDCAVATLVNHGEVVRNAKVQTE